MRTKIAEIRALGAELWVVGCGTAQNAAWFVEDQSPDFPVLTDPTGQVYRAAGLKSGVFRILNPISAFHYLVAFLKGFRQEGIKGDRFQVGGVLIVLRGGQLAFRRANETAGGHIDAGTLVRKLRDLLSQASLT